MATNESNYPEELAARLAFQQRTSRIKRRDYLAAFMAARSDVMEAMAAGFAQKVIWEHMSETGRIPFRYETFLKYVHQHITNAPAGSSRPVTNGKVSGPAKRN